MANGHGGGGKGKHKMNRGWQAAADEAKTLVPGGDAQAEAGIQRMFDAIEEAGADPKARFNAAIDAFIANTQELKTSVAQTNTSPEEAAQITEALLKHTVKHFPEIAHSVKHGHKKD